MNTNCVRISKADGERVRSRFMDLDILDSNFKIRSEGDQLLIPVKSDSVEGYVVEQHPMEETVHEETDYKELLDMSDDLKAELPRSYDVVGDVAIIKLTDSLMEYRGEIGKALMKVTPNLRIVMLDSGVKGDLRIRDLKVIAGEGTSETIHKEFGVRMLTDPSKVYFNSRLATERARIASDVKDGEIIIDMFAGVAPFGTVICKMANPKIVYSIDLNHDAEYFMRMNMEMNHIIQMVPITGDARIEITKLPEADRILMNLPQMADEFIVDALRKTKVGGKIHLHKVMERAEMETFKQGLVERSKQAGYDIEFSAVTELKTYSPTMSVYVFDIVHKTNDKTLCTVNSNVVKVTCRFMKR